jgi:hypothetical protein
MDKNSTQIKCKNTMAELKTKLKRKLNVVDFINASADSEQKKKECL